LVQNRIESTLEALRLISRSMGGASGRKSLLWITAGFPPYTNYRDRIESTIAAVNQHNVAVYSVDTRGLLPGRFAGITISTMQDLAESTGGQAYYNRNDVGQAIVEAMDDSRHTYSLAFYLPEKDVDGQSHHLTVKVDRPGLDLHYRRAYEATINTQQQPTKKQESLETELLRPLDRSTLGIDAKVEIVQAERTLVAYRDRARSVDGRAEAARRHARNEALRAVCCDRCRGASARANVNERHGGSSAGQAGRLLFAHYPAESWCAVRADGRPRHGLRPHGEADDPGV
jgi:hypothetical protein